MKGTRTYKVTWNTNSISTVSCPRMYLHIANLSDISDGDGRTVNKDIMVGQRPSDRNSPLGIVWPRQEPTVTKSQVSQTLGKISEDPLCDN